MQQSQAAYEISEFCQLDSVARIIYVPKFQVILDARSPGTHKDSSGHPVYSCDWCGTE